MLDSIFPDCRLLLDDVICSHLTLPLYLTEAKFETTVGEGKLEEKTKLIVLSVTQQMEGIRHKTAQPT